MKNLKLWGLALGIFSCLGATGENVYVYNNTADEPIQSFTDIRKITFAEDRMSLTAADNTASEMLFSDFHYFTFAKRELSAVGAVQDSKVNVSLDAQSNILSVKADRTMDRIELFSVQGGLVCEDVPRSCEYDQSIEAYPAGLYIVEITMGGQQEYHKIIKK